MAQVLPRQKQAAVVMGSEGFGEAAGDSLLGSYPLLWSLHTTPMVRQGRESAGMLQGSLFPGQCLHSR